MVSADSSDPVPVIRISSKFHICASLVLIMAIPARYMHTGQPQGICRDVLHIIKTVLSFIPVALVQYTPQGLVTFLYVTVESSLVVSFQICILLSFYCGPGNWGCDSFTRYVLQVGCTDAGIINGIEVTLYNDCGWSPNDNTYDIGAVDHIDNGETCTDCSCK